MNLVDQRGCTPLHYAAQLGSGRVTKLLIDGGADVTIRDLTGCTGTDRAKVEKSICFGCSEWRGANRIRFRSRHFLSAKVCRLATIKGEIFNIFL